MECLVDFGSELVQFLLTHWTTLFIGLFVLAVLYWYGTQVSRSIKSRFPDLPGPKPWPFLNFMPDALSAGGELHLLFDRYHKQYGGQVYTFSFLKLPSLVVSDPEMVKAVMVKNFDYFHDRPERFRYPKPLHVELDALRGETWRRTRNTVSPIFSGHKLKAMVPLMNMSCDTLLKKMDEVAESGKSFDILSYQEAVTLEIIISTVFGVQSECQTNPDEPVMAKAIATVQPSTKHSIRSIILPLFPYGKSFPTRSKLGARMFYKPMLELSDSVKDVIDARKKDGSTRKDILDLMLNATNSSNENKKLTDEEVVSQCISFLLAGFEASSTTLSLVCYHLATNPDVQDKLHQEIDSVWTDEDKMPSYDIVHELPYLEMVISETIRLCPPGFLLFRECTKDCTIKGIRVPHGTPILIPVYSIHRDPKNYPDPDKFDPERFSAEAKQSRNPYTYIPFGHGPRNCIGIRFAQMEMKLVLVRILKKYSFRTTPETIVPPKVTSRNARSLTVMHGINLRVEGRG